MESYYYLSEIENAAKKFVELLKDHPVVAFSGNLGAGKTTFIHSLCRQLGVLENMSSPTFPIINQYITADNKNIFHIDLYRIKNNDEAIDAGLEECIYSGDICFIEWPDKISFLPDNTVKINIEQVNETQRKIICKLP